MALLEVEGLRVDLATGRGRLSAVRGIDLAVERGKTLCLVGESGCGKSMTALALMGLLPRIATRQVDRLRFDGEDLVAGGRKAIESLRGRRIGMIFQEPMTSLNPAFSVGEQMTEGVRRQMKLPDAEARRRAVTMLARVGIANGEERLGQYPHQLSGGLRQRVMIAMALMAEPDLLIADEPTTALDVTIQAQILRLLKSLQEDNGIGLLLVTHDLGVVAQMADDVAVMYAGQIVERGAVDAVFRRPMHPYSRGLMECVPVPGRTARGAMLGTIAGTVPSLTKPIPGCAFRERCAMARAECAGRIPWQVEPGDGGGAQHGRLCILPAEWPTASSADSPDPVGIAR